MAARQGVLVVALRVGRQADALRQVERHLVARERCNLVGQAHHDVAYAVNGLCRCVDGDIFYYRRLFYRHIERNVFSIIGLGTGIGEDDIL